jgi:hypothetical protein
MSLHFVTVPPGLTGVLNDAGCIEWQGNKLGNGYGRIWMDGKAVLVHRLVLESKVPGFLESGYLACHTCDHPSCINPEHLVPGTAADNTRQIMERGRKTSRSQSLPGSGKLTVHQLREIQAKYAGKISKRQLAREYGVNQQTITKIVKANIPESWTTVTPGFLGEIQDNGCIIFMGAKDGKGYGRYRTHDGKLGTVSRAVLAAKVGYNLPYKIDACHTCDNPSCINPDHLWPGTRSQNLLDASKKGRTQGKSHPLGNAKLDWDKVQEIRRKLEAGARMKDLAEELWVARLSTTLNITRLGRWKALSLLPL